MAQINISTISSKLKPMLEYLNKQKENEKFYSSLELNATVFLIIFFLIFAIRPTVITISSLIGEINSKEVQKVQMKSKINQIIKAQDLYSQVQGQYELIAQCLPDSPSYSQVANQYLKASGESQISLDELKFIFSNINTGSDHLRSYSVPVVISGTFNQVSQVLNNIVNNRRLVQAPQATFTINTDNITANNSTPSGEINASINTNVYYWLPDNEKK